MSRFSMGKEPEPPPPEADVFKPPRDDRTPEQKEIDRAITAIAGRWNSLPTIVVKQGWFDVAAGAPGARIGNVEIPDGRYRIQGHEWVLEFKDGALVRGDRVTTHERGDEDEKVAGRKIDSDSYRTVIYTTE